MTKVTSGRVIATLILSCLSDVGGADHGRDFLLVQTARLGYTGNVFGIARLDYVREDERDAYLFEPLLSWTARDWLSLEINSDADKVEGESLNYNATAPGVRLRFTPKEQALGLGLAVHEEIAAESDRDNVLKLAALGNYETGSWLFGINLDYEKPESARHEWGYAAGIKRELRHHLGVALEVAGSFEEEKSGEVVAGFFYELTHRLQVNTGIGTGFNNDVDLSIKTALIWSFR